MTNTITSRTLSSIVRNKVLDQVEQKSLSSVVRDVVLFTCAVIMIIIVNNPQATADRFRNSREHHSFFMVSSFVSFYVFMNLQRLFNKFSTIEFNRYEEEVEKEQSEWWMIEWIPVLELIDHLFVAKSFKREDIEKKFWIARHRFADVANALEECWILVRWQNNSRVLNDKITRQEIVACIAQAEKIEQIVRRPIAKNENEYLFADVSNMIEERVSDALNCTAEATDFNHRSVLQTASEL